MTKEEIRENNRIRNTEWRNKDREAYNKYMRDWKSNNKHRTARYKLSSRYGITSEQYEEMSKSQNNKCAICGKEETACHNTSREVLKLAVDHCHKTGKVRELLCQDCNRGIAKFKEDPEVMWAAAEYIIKHRKSVI